MLSVKTRKIVMFSVIKKITVKCENNNLTQLKFHREGNYARNNNNSLTSP